MVSFKDIVRKEMTFGNGRTCLERIDGALLDSLSQKFQVAFLEAPNREALQSLQNLWNTIKKENNHDRPRHK